MADATRELLFKIITQADIAGLDTVEKKLAAVEVAARKLEDEAKQLNATKVGPQADVTPVQLLEKKITDATAAATRANNVVIKPKADTTQLSAVVDRMKDIEKEVQTLEGDLGKVGAGFGLSLAAGIGAASAAITAMVAEGVKLNTQLESSTLATAALLRQFEPTKFASVSAALSASSDALAKIRQAAIDAGLPFEGLVSTLQGTAAAAYGASIPFQDQLKLLPALTAAAKTYGLSQDQLTTQLRALYEGRVEAENQLAHGLGITKDDIALNQQQGKVLEFVTERLRSSADAGKLYAKSFEGVRETVSQEIQGLEIELSKPITAALKEGLDQLAIELKKPEVREALKALGFELAEIVKTGASLVNFAVRNADALLAMGKAAGVLAVALAALKIRDLIAQFAEKAIRLAALRTEMAATVVTSTELSAAQTREAITANEAAVAQGRLGAARTASGQAGAGAAAAAGAAGAGGLLGAGAGAGAAAAGGYGRQALAALLGGPGALGLFLGLATKEYIDSLAAGIRQLADDADKAGATLKDFEKGRAEAISQAKTGEEARKVAASQTATELGRVKKELDDYRASLTVSVEETDAMGNATGRVTVFTKELNQAESERLRILEAQYDRRVREATDPRILNNLVSRTRGSTPDGGGAGRLNTAELDQYNASLAADEKRRLTALPPSLQLKEYASQTEQLLEATRQQLLALGVAKEVVDKLKDINSLENFAEANPNKAGAAVAKQLGALRDLDKERTDAAKAYADQQQKSGQDLATLTTQQNTARSQDIELTRQKYDLEEQLTAALAARNRLLEVPTDDKERLANTQAVADADQRINDIREKQRQLGLSLGTVQATEKATQDAILDTLKRQTDEQAKQLAFLKSKEAGLREQIETAKQAGQATADLDKKLADNLRQQGQRGPGGPVNVTYGHEAPETGKTPEVPLRDPNASREIKYSGGQTQGQPQPLFTPPQGTVTREGNADVYRAPDTKDNNARAAADIFGPGGLLDLTGQRGQQVSPLPNFSTEGRQPKTNAERALDNLFGRGGYFSDSGLLGPKAEATPQRLPGDPVRQPTPAETSAAAAALRDLFRPDGAGVAPLPPLVPNSPFPPPPYQAPAPGSPLRREGDPAGPPQSTESTAGEIGLSRTPLPPPPGLSFPPGYENIPGSISGAPEGFATGPGKVDAAAEATKKTADELDKSGGAIKDAAEKQQKAAEDNLPATADASKASADAQQSNLPQIATAAQGAADAANANLPAIATANEALGTSLDKGLADASKSVEGLSEKFGKGIEDLSKGFVDFGHSALAAISAFKEDIAALRREMNRNAGPSQAEWDSFTGAG